MRTTTTYVRFAGNSEALRPFLRAGNHEAIKAFAYEVEQLRRVPLAAMAKAAGIDPAGQPAFELRRALIAHKADNPDAE